MVFDKSHCEWTTAKAKKTKGFSSTVMHYAALKWNEWGIVIMASNFYRIIPRLECGFLSPETELWHESISHELQAEQPINGKLVGGKTLASNLMCLDLKCHSQVGKTDHLECAKSKSFLLSQTLLESLSCCLLKLALDSAMRKGISTSIFLGGHEWSTLIRSLF